MKILLIHSDFLEYEPKTKAIKDAEECKKEKKRIEDCLVVLTSVEKKDSDNEAKKAIAEIEKVAEEVKAKKIVIYPWVHLSNEPAAPSDALSLLKEVASGIKNYEVHRAPFGWYKAFDIKCKGHPLSELSREIKGGEESEAVKKEETLKSEWFIAEPSGKMHKISKKGDKIEGFDFSKFKGLEKMVKYEMAKSRVMDKEPPHIKFMKKLEICQYEEGSDPGHFRWLPKGRLIKSLIEDWVTQETVAYGAMEVQTPIMYDYEHPSLKNYLNRFPARQYTIHTPNKKVFLNFSACFGQFLIMHDAMVSYKDLPMRLYELKPSFRVEQRGELAGLRRLRAFTMPDVHAFCKDEEQAKEEMLKRLELAEKVVTGCGFEKEDFGFAIRVVKDFYEKHEDFVKGLVKKWGVPTLVEMWDKRFFYYVLKHEFNFIDALDKAACLTTDQIDVENAERYDITYTDKDNKKKYPLILHMSPSGAIERVIYALLEKYHMESEAAKKEGKKYNPVFPLWLAPVQVRLCPVSDEFNKDAEKMADELAKNCIRVDIDDRTESISKKVRDAEMEWVNMVIVIGEKEKSGNLPVRLRETSQVKNMKIDELISNIRKETEGKPFKQLSLPRSLSRRIVFG